MLVVGASEPQVHRVAARGGLPGARGRRRRRRVGGARRGRGRPRHRRPRDGWPRGRRVLRAAPRGPPPRGGLAAGDHAPRAGSPTPPSKPAPTTTCTGRSPAASCSPAPAPGCARPSSAPTTRCPLADGQRPRRDLPLGVARQPPLELISDEIERISGHPPHSFIAAQPAHDHEHRPPRRPRGRDARRRRTRAARGDAFELEYRIVRADGEVRWVLDRGQPVPGPAGRLWMDGALFDITERRAAEEALRARRSTPRARRSCARRACGSSRPPTPRGAGSSATCTTAPSSGSSSSRSTCGSPAAASSKDPRRRRPVPRALRRRARWRPRPSCASWPAASTPPCSPSAASAPAIAALAARAPVPVEVLDVPGDRLRRAVETTAYFTVAEALTNVAKYADASEADGARRVRGRRPRRRGPRRRRRRRATDAGSGLSGLADRVEAVDGVAEHREPAGRGDDRPRGAPARRRATLSRPDGLQRAPGADGSPSTFGGHGDGTDSPPARARGTGDARDGHGRRPRGAAGRRRVGGGADGADARPDGRHRAERDPARRGQPASLATTYFFQYGPTAAYGAQTAPTALAAGAAAVNVSAPGVGLVPAATFHVRLVATNASGTSVTADRNWYCSLDSVPCCCAQARSKMSSPRQQSLRRQDH